MFNVYKRVFRGLKNDKRSLFLIFFAPVLAMFIFGTAFSGEVSNINIVLLKNPFIEELSKNLDEKTFNISYTDSLEDGKTKVEQGATWAFISYDKNITIYLDKSNVNIASKVLEEFKKSYMEILKERGFTIPLNIEKVDIYGRGAEFIDFFVPGIMAFATFLLTTLLTLLTFVSERLSGTLERLLASPLRERDIVFGYAAAFGIIGIMQSFILLVIAIAVFNIMIVGNILLAFLIIVLLAIVSQSLGILLSSLAKREMQAIQFLPFIVLPTFLLSGIFWPLEAIPSFLRPFSYLLPPTYAIDALRSIFIRGGGWKKSFLT